MIDQDKFTYSPLQKSSRKQRKKTEDPTKKQIKTIEDANEKQAKALPTLNTYKQSKSINNLFSKDFLISKAKDELKKLI